MTRRRLTAFLSGRICEAFRHGESFAYLALRLGISMAAAEDVVRRWQRRVRRGG